MFSKILDPGAGLPHNKDAGQITGQGCRRTIWALLGLVTLACGTLDFDIPNPEGNMPAAADQSGLVVPAETAAYTHVRADGNRLAAGNINMAAVEPLTIPLSGTPTWVLGARLEGQILWLVALDDGRLEAVTIGLDQVVSTELLAQSLEPGQPFVLLSGRGQYAVEGIDSRTVRPPNDLDRLVGVTPDGGLMTSTEGDIRRAAGSVVPLPDGRLLADEQGRALLLSDPTDRYAHGVLGDTVEAGSITLIETQPELVTRTVIPIPVPRVVEGLMPIWADLNDDGRREIVVTVSDRDLGAQLVVFSEDGEQLAASDPIGQGSRWRNQTAVAPFGPQGDLELADVRTPHLSGTVEFFRWVDGSSRLERTAALPGYTTHVIGSRNLDLGIAADVTGDGRVSMLLPTLARTELAAIQRSNEAEGGAVELWRLPLAGRQVTNLATLTTGSNLSLALGTDAGMLMVWGGG